MGEDKQQLRSGQAALREAFAVRGMLASHDCSRSSRIGKERASVAPGGRRGVRRLAAQLHADDGVVEVGRGRKRLRGKFLRFALPAVTVEAVRASPRARDR